MQAIEAFQANDGSIFTTIADCQDYEDSLIWRSRVEEFQASNFNPYERGARQVGMSLKIIVAWENFKLSQSIKDNNK